MPFGGGSAFNGGTITAPLVIATADPTAVPLQVRASWNAQVANFFAVVNTDTSIEMLAVNPSGATVAADHATGAPLGQFGSSSSLGNSVVLQSGAQLGFFGHAVASQPAAPTTLADVIAALKALGLVAT